MKIENNGYIPIRNYSKHPITKNEKETIGGLLEKFKKLAEDVLKIIPETTIEEKNFLLKLQEDYNRSVENYDKSLENYNRIFSLLESKLNTISTTMKKEKEVSPSKDLELINGRIVCSSSVNSQKSDQLVSSGVVDNNNSVSRYNPSNNVDRDKDIEMEIRKFKDAINKQREHIKLLRDFNKAVRKISHMLLLRSGDLCLASRDHEEAIKTYNWALSIKFKYDPPQIQQIDDDYVPLDEKLRQASKLYVSMQHMVNKLNLDEDTRLDLFASGIAAHTQGKFSLSKPEVLDMINKGFYYS
jgi:tetratricopeptide (TPR) repeat protein